MIIPRVAENIEVDAKYTIIQDTILPLIRAFKLADTVMRLDMSIGKVSNFNIRRNNSPGYEINMMVSLEKLYERNVIPKNVCKNNFNLFFIKMLEVWNQFLFIPTSTLFEIKRK